MTVHMTFSRVITPDDMYRYIYMYYRHYYVLPLCYLLHTSSSMVPGGHPGLLTSVRFRFFFFFFFFFWSNIGPAAAGPAGPPATALYLLPTPDADAALPLQNQTALSQVPFQLKMLLPLSKILVCEHGELVMQTLHFHDRTALGSANTVLRAWEQSFQTPLSCEKQTWHRRTAVWFPGLILPL